MTYCTHIFSGIYRLLLLARPTENGNKINTFRKKKIFDSYNINKSITVDSYYYMYRLAYIQNYRHSTCGSRYIIPNAISRWINDPLQENILHQETNV